MADTPRIGPRDRRRALRILRKQAGLSLQELADLCGVHVTMVNKWELGHRALSPESFERVKGVVGKIKLEQEEKARVQELADELFYISAAAKELGTHLTPSEETEALGEVRVAKAAGTFPATPSKGHLQHAAVVLPSFYLGMVSSVVERRIEQRRQRAAQLAALENLRARGIDDPVIVEIIESLRREIADKDVLLQEMSRALEKSADD